MLKSQIALFSFVSLLVCGAIFGQDFYREENHMGAFQTVKRSELLIIGLECRTSNNPDAAPIDIPRLRDKFFGEGFVDLVPGKKSDEYISLYCEYEGDHTKPYTFVIGCPVESLDDIPEGMVGKSVPAGKYAMFKAVGEHPWALIETWGNIWQTKLDRTYTGDYEIYGEKFFSRSPQEIEIFIAIE
jgi:predicted transcriptional regulator YdeE